VLVETSGWCLAPQGHAAKTQGGYLGRIIRKVNYWKWATWTSWTIYITVGRHRGGFSWSLSGQRLSHGHL
jgi:hypothetical protein